MNVFQVHRLRPQAAIRSGPGSEQFHCMYIQRVGNRFDLVDRHSMFGMFDFADIAAVKIGTLRKCLLAETSGPSKVLYVQTELYAQLHAKCRATLSRL